MVHIVDKGKDRHQKVGKTRSEQERNLRKEWGHTITDEQLDKLEFQERKIEKRTGSKKNFVRGHIIDTVDEKPLDHKPWTDWYPYSTPSFRSNYEGIKWNN